MAEAKAWVPLILILLLGGVLLFSHLDLYDIWGDEVFSFPKGDTFAEVFTWAKWVPSQVHPPLYNFLQFFWEKVFAGDDTTRNRLVYAFFGWINIFLVYLLGKRLFNRKVALFAALLTATSPFLIQYSRMVRYYPLTATLVLLTLLTFVRLEENFNLRNWVWFTLSGALLIYEDYLGWTILLTLYLYLAFRFPKVRGQIRQWILAGAVMFLLFTPWIPVLTSQLGHESSPYPKYAEKVQTQAPRVAQKPLGLRGMIFDSVLKTGFLAYIFTSGETTYFWHLWITAPVGLTFLFLFLVALRRCRKKEDTSTRWLFFVFLVSLVVLVALSEIYDVFSSRIFQFPSKVLFLLPLFLLLVARGWSLLKSRPVAVAAALVILSGNAYGITNYYGGRQFLNPKYLVPWREIEADILNTADPGDLILTDEEAFLHYLKISRCPLAFYGLVGAQQKADSLLAVKGPFHIYLVIRYRGDEVIVLEGLRIKDAFDRKYDLVEAQHYKPTDPEAAPYWKRFLGRDPYPYLVDVFRFRVEKPSENRSQTAESPPL